MSGDTQPAKPRRRGRWLGLLVLMLVLIAAGCVVAWSQRDALLEYGIERVLEADAVVTGFHPGKVTRISYAHLADPEDAADTPALAARDVTIHLGEGDRYISELNIDELSVALLRSSGNNHEFLNRLTEGDGGGDFDVTPYLPESIAVRSLPLRVSTTGGSLSLDGLGLTAALRSLAEADIELRGETVSGKWLVPELDLGWREVSGALNGRVSYRPDAIDAEFSAGLPGLAEGAGQLTWTRDGGFDVAIGETRLSGGLWLELIRPWLPVEATFESVHIAEASVNAAYEAAVKGDIAGLRIGPADVPWYSGPVSVDLTGTAGDTLKISGNVELSDGASTTLEYEEREDAVRFELDTNTWPRPVVENLLRATGTDVLAILPRLDGLEVACGVAISHPATHGEFTLSPTFGGTNRDYPLQAKLTSTPNIGWVVEARLSGDQALTGEFGYPPDGVWDARVDVAALDDTAAFLLDWFDLDFTELLKSSIEGGSLKLTHNGPTTVMTEANLSGAFTELGPLAPSAATPYRLEFAGNYQIDNALVDGARIAFDIPNQGRFFSSNAQVGSELITMGWKSDFDLEDLLPMLGIGDWSGTANAEGSLRYAGSTLAITGLKASLGHVNYAGTLLPSEHPLALSGSARVDVDSGVATGDLTAAWGPETRIESTGYQFDTTSGRLQSEQLNFVSDLSIAIAMGHVSSGDARLRVTGENIAWDETTTGGTAALLLEGGLVLPDDMLAMSGVDLEVYANLENGGSGAGPFAAQEIAAFGASFRDVSAQVRLVGLETVFEEAAATLWGGTVRAHGRANVFAENLPLSLEALVEGIDLALFSRAFELPYGELTGTVSGFISASIEGEKITALDADLESEENFTMGREMVVQALMSQNDAEVSGSKVISKVVAKVIGDDVQRPFDRARIRLGLSGERITGVAELNSPRLNLTVDIAADQAAILEVISAAQEGKIEQFQTRWQ